METRSSRYAVEESPTPPGGVVSVFLDTVKREQARFLDAVAHATAQLGREPGQLACVAATQQRLTRQFFDAQRSLLTRRAEVDAEVASIGQAADESADSLVAAARSRAGGLTWEPHAKGFPVADASRTSLGAVRSSANGVAALGIDLVRTTEDADVLARVIDDAFEPHEPDGVTARQQLASLLDDWWHAANQEGRAIVDDAHARATVRHHIATIEANELLEAVRDVEGAAAPAELMLQLPAHMVAALDTAEAHGLESLLAALADSLAPVPTSAPASVSAGVPGSALSAVDDLVIRVDLLSATDLAPLPATPCPAEIAPEDAFRRFWAVNPVGPTSQGSRGWFPVRAVLAMTAVTSAITVAMAWIG